MQAIRITLPSGRTIVSYLGTLSSPPLRPFASLSNYGGRLAVRFFLSQLERRHRDWEMAETCYSIERVQGTSGPGRGPSASHGSCEPHEYGNQNVSVILSFEVSAQVILLLSWFHDSFGRPGASGIGRLGRVFYRPRFLPSPKSADDGAGSKDRQFCRSPWRRSGYDRSGCSRLRVSYDGDHQSGSGCSRDACLAQASTTWSFSRSV